MKNRDEKYYSSYGDTVLPIYIYTVGTTEYGNSVVVFIDTPPLPRGKGLINKYLFFFGGGIWKRETKQGTVKKNRKG